MPELKINAANLRKMIYNGSKEENILTDTGKEVLDLTDKYRNNLPACSQNLIFNLQMLSGDNSLFLDSIAQWQADKYNNIVDKIKSYKPRAVK